MFLPITSSPGYQPGNKLPYAEHFNFSIQRQLGSSTVLTLAYVGTEGHKLFAQYEANPGNAALCLSLRGSGVAKGTLQCGPNQENAIFTRPDGSQVFGTRGPLGFDFGSNTYESTNANSAYNSLQVTRGAARQGSDVPGGIHVQQVDGQRLRLQHDELLEFPPEPRALVVRCHPQLRRSATTTRCRSTAHSRARPSA